MNGIGEIVLLGIILIASIIGSINKNKKKNAHRNISSPEESATEIQEIPVRNKYNDPVMKDDPFDFSNNSQYEGTRQMMSLSKQYASGTKDKYNIDKKIKTSHIEAKQGLSEDVFKDNEIVREFDIRKAVLYSEIMNPKFKE